MSRYINIGRVLPCGQHTLGYPWRQACLSPLKSIIPNNCLRKNRINSESVSIVGKRKRTVTVSIRDTLPTVLMPLTMVSANSQVIVFTSNSHLNICGVWRCFAALASQNRWHSMHTGRTGCHRNPMSQMKSLGRPEVELSPRSRLWQSRRNHSNLKGSRQLWSHLASVPARGY